MGRPAESFFRTLILAAFVVPVLSRSAAAQAEFRGPSAEIFGGYFLGYSSSAGFRFSDELLGLRGSYRFSRVWAVEGALSRSDSDLLTWSGDFSAKAYLLQKDVFGLFALAGPGIQRVSLGHQQHDDRTTVHAGIGADFAVSPRIYLRPEILFRWPTEHLDERHHATDYTIGVGWRF
jgi:hypothetical protein